MLEKNVVQCKKKTKHTEGKRERANTEKVETFLYLCMLISFEIHCFALAEPSF